MKNDWHSRFAALGISVVMFCVGVGIMTIWQEWHLEPLEDPYSWIRHSYRYEPDLKAFERREKSISGESGKVGIKTGHIRPGYHAVFGYSSVAGDADLVGTSDGLLYITEWYPSGSREWWAHYDGGKR